MVAADILGVLLLWWNIMSPFRQSQPALTFGTPQLHLVVQSLCRRAVPSQLFFVLEGSARNLRIPGISAASFWFLYVICDNVSTWRHEDTPKTEICQSFFSSFVALYGLRTYFCTRLTNSRIQETRPQLLSAKTRVPHLIWRTRVSSFYYSNRFLPFFEIPLGTVIL